MTDDPKPDTLSSQAPAAQVLSNVKQQEPATAGGSTPAPAVVTSSSLSADVVPYIQ